MDYRQLGRSGLRVSSLTLGTMTFGGGGKFANVGTTDVDGARRQIDMCLDAGVNMIDTADVYSDGASEEILGQALAGPPRRRARGHQGAHGDGRRARTTPGLSRHHLIRACEASLRRLGTDYIDLYQVHEWDGVTPMEETLGALDDLVRAGKVRYVGCSNFSGWQMSKALGVSERLGLERYVSQQIYYSLQSRDAEYEIVPACLDQGVGILVWSPLAGGLLSGKYRRGQQGAGGLAPPDGLERAARPRRGADLRRDRGRGRDRRGARRLGRAGRARVAARAPRRELARDRRAHRGAAGRQPRGRRAGALGGGARPARRAERAPADLPPLAPGQDVGRPARAGRPRLAGAPTWTRASAPAAGRSRG